MNIKLRTKPAMLAAFSQEMRDSTSSPLFQVPLATATAEVSADSAVLRAYSRRWLRKLLVIGWSSYLIASPWWTPDSKLIACLIAVAVFGTYRQTLICKTNVSWKLWLAFIPLGTWNCSLQGAHSLSSEWEEQGGMLEALMLGMWGLFFAPLIDWLSPFRGGVFKLSIKTGDGRKILIWRGRSMRAFHSNHRLLQTVTQLPAPREFNRLSS